MPDDEPIRIQKLAQELARFPGRLEIDKQEAWRIAVDTAERYIRGEFDQKEVVAMVARDPPRFLPYIETGEYDGKTLNLNLWWAAIALTRPAALRYLENCGLTGAERVLREMFGAPAAPPQLRKAPGPRPALREKITQRMLHDLRSGNRSAEELESDKFSALAQQYGGSPNTAALARKKALALAKLPIKLVISDQRSIGDDP